MMCAHTHTQGTYGENVCFYPVPPVPSCASTSTPELLHNSQPTQTGARMKKQQAKTEAENAGAIIQKPAKDVFWGGYSGYFSDLDGHLWEVAWNPHFWPGPKDEVDA